MDDLKQANWIQGLTFLFGWIVGAVIFMGLAVREHDYKKPILSHYGLAFWFLSIDCSLILGTLLRYHSLPTWLTFGTRIGGILPTNCEASMKVEGPEGLPCELKRFGEWAKRVVSSDGSWHTDEIERLWIECLVCVIVVIFTISIMLWLAQRIKREHILEHAALEESEKLTGARSEASEV